MRFTITHCPNTPEVHKAADRLRFPSWESRRRGRKPTYCGAWREKVYSLPMINAQEFTYYGIEQGPIEYYETWNGKRGSFRKPVEPYGEYTRYIYAGLTDNGKLRIRPTS